MIDIRNITEEDKLLLSKIQDNIQIANTQYRPKFTAFLDERQKSLVSQFAAANARLPYKFWGGYEQAQRVVFGVFDDYSTPDENQFPIDLVYFTFRKQDTPGHRDFLGSIMALLIKREAIGDILIEEGRAMVSCLKTVSPLIMQLDKIGRWGVKTSLNDQNPVVVLQQFDVIEGTVASNRLDAVLSLAIRKSREYTQKLIAQGYVQVNYFEQTNNALQLKEDDILSVRGYGKMRLHRIGDLTRKNRLSLEIYKYK